MDAGITPSWWSDARLHIVSGKGGTGKTTVAAALAIALATGGKRTLLVEVEDRQGIAQLFSVPPLPYGERPIASAPGGGEVYALAVEPEAALIEYLDMFYNLGRAGNMLRRVGAIDFATAVAPGLRDVLLSGKVKEATTRVKDGRRAYDAVVLDAPPTGRISRFLNVTAEVAQLAKVGPIKKQSDGVQDLLRSPRTAIHLVTLLEEMPVQETIEATADLHAIGLDVDSIIINLATEPQMSAGELDEIASGDNPSGEIKKGLAEGGLATDLAPGLAGELVEYAQRFTSEQQARALLPSLDIPITELPRVYTKMPTALYELAGIIREQVGEEAIVDV